MCSPNWVRSRRSVQTASTPSTIGTTQGTPSIGRKVPRLTLQMATTTIPATARKAILATVRPTGGATSPLRRRRASASHIEPPTAITITASPIQPTIGSMLLLTMPNRTCWLWSTLLEIGTLPAGPSRMIMTPNQSR